MSDDGEISLEEKRHPRRTYDLVGHRQAEAKLLEAYKSGKMHHAWILGGPAGIGKSTLAFRFARFVLRHPDPVLIPDEVTTLEVGESDLVARRIAASAHADLLTISPAWDPKTKKYKREIGVAEARKASGFFTKTAGEGGWRVCIVDPASAMNATAANALLKTLEEPPARVLFLLISDAPGKLMTTIRSRCVQLDMNRLSESDVVKVLKKVPQEGQNSAEDLAGALTWAEGSPGRALLMFETGLQAILIEFTSLAKELPRLNRTRLLAFVDRLAARGAEGQYALFCELFMDWIAAQAKHMVSIGEIGSGGELARAHDEIGRSLNRTNALNLDKRQTLLQAFYRLELAYRQKALS